MPFFEVYWRGECIADAGDLEEALACYIQVRPKELSWPEAWAQAEAEGDPLPCVCRYRSFDAFLDNEEALETIPVTLAMLELAGSEA
ncbi:hypothetical protein KQ304_05710 [Synechococcus sp. CS-1329]|jgi:hypothetical protein|uniref:hypothetical protein n=1 Tax=Synechococcus sp. CS-1329 TaxID=2847975 RepID=UPI00223B505B|nr:hypothetical protein [Synechococcus sp. CS-1329]MCT0218501.1 hypothetical protein [Synechococcus sp. CS-1329]